MQTRRHFIQSTSLAGLSPFILNTSSFFDSKTSLKASLNPGSIGLKCSPQELLDFAIAYKFSAISPPMGALLQMNSIDQQNYLAKMKRHHIVFDSGGLPIEFRTSDEVFQKGFQYLKNNVKAIAALTIPSFVTWIMPTHKQLTYTQNFEQHRIRLQQIADVLSQEGLRLGLEYVGPKTLMARDKYAFIHTISELRELISAIETNNVGYLLDSFHTYCAEDQFEDMNFLEAKDIVSVQINDAVASRSPSTQLDFERELPGASKFIDLKSFVEFIQSKAYNGAVSAEPFNKKVNQMETAAKLEKVRASLAQNGI